MKRLWKSHSIVLLLMLGLVLSGCSLLKPKPVVPPVEEPPIEEEEPPIEELEIPAEGLQLWLRADEGVVEENGRVATWADMSGKDNHAKAKENPPALVETDGGYKAVRFGKGEFVVVPHHDALNAGEAFSVFLVLQSESGNRVMQKKSNASGTQADAWYVARARGLSVAGKDTGKAIMEETDFTLMSNVFDAAKGTISIYKAGNLLHQVTDAVAQIPNEDDLYIGLRDYSNTLEWTGDLFEAIIYNRALNDEERTEVEAYLKEKYGM